MYNANNTGTKKSSIICMFSFGYFPGVRLSFADVSEPSVRSVFKGWMKNILTPGKYPKENIQVSEHGGNLISRSSIMK
jgi:hypothetical protein